MRVTRKRDILPFPRIGSMRAWSMVRSEPTAPREDMSSGTLALVSEARGSIFEPEIFSSEPLAPEDIFGCSSSRLFRCCL